MKHCYKKGKIIGNWTLIRFLGGGGNGEVWTCKNSKGELRAIKLLKRIKQKSYIRFVDETIAIEQNSDIAGIIPIEEKCLPSKLVEQVPYFVMPIANSSEVNLKGKSVEEIIEAIIQVAETLEELHNRKIFHRDIKPANILYYNSRYCLADFGLVDYPNKKEVSFKNEEIGPKWTMAPEMRRESFKADPAKADIYSLAKTLWIYLTENKKGFDGQYSIESIIHLKKFYPESYTSPIDNLLIACTDNDPTKRPNANEFLKALHDWNDLTEDFHKRNIKQWFEIQTKLFPTSIPKRVIWDNTNDIIKILKVVCTYDNLNHFFFPSGGGLDLQDARLSVEENCIELDFQMIGILKPKRLLFESFGDRHEWNYFRLEADELQSTGLYNERNNQPYENNHFFEEVTQLQPGQYEDYSYLENMTENYEDEDEDEYQFPTDAKHITRWFRGSFVIFAKRSIYNLTSSTYDARHDKMSTDEFRDYIQRVINHFNEQEKKEEKVKF